MEAEPRLIGPIIDTETGALVYTVRAGERETEFAVIPAEQDDGATRWIMRAGADRSFLEDSGFEPYETQEEAVDAGMRASMEALT
jgi:hypothetical protein